MYIYLYIDTNIEFFLQLLDFYNIINQGTTKDQKKLEQKKYLTALATAKKCPQDLEEG